MLAAAPSAKPVERSEVEPGDRRVFTSPEKFKPAKTREELLEKTEESLKRIPKP